MDKEHYNREIDFIGPDFRVMGPLQLDLDDKFDACILHV